MSGESNPLRQLAAAWEAATAVVTEWAEQTAAVTSEAFHKLSSDPAIRAVLESWRTTLVWGQRDCKCVCARSHPDDMGICDKRAVITRRLPTDLGGEVYVPLCAPCAVAQGVAEMPRLSLHDGTVASGGSPGWKADGRAVRLVRPRSGPTAVMAAPLICSRFNLWRASERASGRSTGLTSSRLRSSDLETVGPDPAGRGGETHLLVLWRRIRGRTCPAAKARAAKDGNRLILRPALRMPGAAFPAAGPNVTGLQARDGAPGCSAAFNRTERAKRETGVAQRLARLRTP
jgi:hypothetical protein